VAALVVVAAGGLLVRTNQPRTVPIPATSQTLPAAAEADVVTNTVTAAGRQSPTIPTIPNRRPVATGTNIAGPITPEPVIPRQEITAVRQLIAVAQEGRFAYQPVGEALPVESEITPPEIVVSPIALLPLGGAETSE
jgi:hypothetical protein